VARQFDITTEARKNTEKVATKLEGRAAAGPEHQTQVSSVLKRYERSHSEILIFEETPFCRSHDATLGMHNADLGEFCPPRPCIISTASQYPSTWTL